LKKLYKFIPRRNLDSAFIAALDDFGIFHGYLVESFNLYIYDCKVLLCINNSINKLREQ